MLKLIMAPNVPTRRNGLTPLRLRTVRVRALVVVLKHFEQTLMKSMLTYSYYGLPCRSLPVASSVTSIVCLFRRDRGSVRVMVLCVVVPPCGPSVTTSVSNRTSGGMVNLKIPVGSLSSSRLLTTLLIRLTYVQMVMCSFRFPSLPWVESRLLTLALYMFIAPAAPDSMGGTLNVSNVGQETSEDVLIVHLMNFVLTLVISISSKAATDIFVTTIVLFLQNLHAASSQAMGVESNGLVFVHYVPV